MDRNEVTFWLTCLGLICWAVCFWWMHSISTRQNSLLEHLQKQGKRIEELSKAEHDLIRDVHPQVGEIKDNVEEVKETVKRRPRGD